jgi:hypothetical protein
MRMSTVLSSLWILSSKIGELSLLRLRLEYTDPEEWEVYLSLVLVTRQKTSSESFLAVD